MGTVIKDILAVVPVDGTLKAQTHTIYIEGSEIAAIDDMPHGFEAAETIDGRGKAAIPGLVNAHTHTYMSFMRNMADDLSFMDWLFGAVSPVEEAMTADDAYWGSLLGQIEMIRSGTTTFNDMHMNIHATTRAAAESGMRAVISRGLTGDAYDKANVRLMEALEEMRDGDGCDRLKFMLGPHAPYTCNQDFLRACAEVAGELGVGIHIHLAESAAEIENMRRDHDCTPIEYARDAGVFEVPVIAAHCVRVSESDMQILADAHASVATNPASNMKLGNGFAPVPEMIEAGINVCLGTDGAASNNAQNMFREMGLLALIHKGTHDTPQCISAADALKMATSNGAAALGLNTGSIEVGKKADIAILDLDRPTLVPNNNLIAALAYSASGSEVETVIIDGKTVMSEGEILTIDEERVRREVRGTCERLMA